MRTSYLIITASQHSKSTRNTAHRSHLRRSRASFIIFVTRHSKLFCSSKMLRAKFKRIWLRLYSRTLFSKSCAFWIPVEWDHKKLVFPTKPFYDLLQPQKSSHQSHKTLNIAWKLQHHAPWTLLALWIDMSLSSNNPSLVYVFSPFVLFIIWATPMTSPS